MIGNSYLSYVALSLATYSGLAASEPVQYCPLEDICYQVAVPEVSASANSGNIYLQLRAPTTYSWVALGTGQGMANSNIFVMYQDGNGNVTLSARAGFGHGMPRHNTNTQLELLTGSGVVDNGQTMIANARCGNCGTWTGGSMNLAGEETDWIAAWKTGASIDSGDADAAIGYHNRHDRWTFDLTQASVADDVNPFAVRLFDNGDRGSASSGDSSADPRALILGHGVVMAVVMVIMYPLGSSLMPLFGKWVLHASWQLLAFLLMWAGFGLGVVASQRIRIDFNSTHTILGTAVVCLMVVQPVLGWLHHRYFVKNQRRGAVSYAHIWYGRALMIMGVVNGGLGLELAHASRKFVAVYAILAGVIFAIYTGAALFGELRRRRRGSYEQKSS